MDDSMQTTVPSGPDPTNPDWIFWDGRGIGCVRSMPVEVPTWGAKAIHYEILDLIVYPAVSWARRLWWRRIRGDYDDRWKVIAARSRRQFPYFSRVYAIRFVGTEEEAVALQSQMLRDYPSSQYAEAKPIGPRERRRLRVA